MNGLLEFERLGRRQLALKEGLELLQAAQTELRQSRSSAEWWATAAIVAEMVIIPANCIINAFQMKAAKSTYDILVHALYREFGRSGARLDGTGWDAFRRLKRLIVEDLKRRGLGSYVPGVNILIGLAEDSLTAWKTIKTVDVGNREMQGMAVRLEYKITAAMQALRQLGIERAQLWDRMERISRIA